MSAGHPLSFQMHWTVGTAASEWIPAHPAIYFRPFRGVSLVRITHLRGDLQQHSVPVGSSGVRARLGRLLKGKRERHLFCCAIGNEWHDLSALWQERRGRWLDAATSVSDDRHIACKPNPAMATETSHYSRARIASDVESPGTSS